MQQHSKTDLVVVGAGIVGLACALVAVEQGLSVTVVERDAASNGASVRNFGFVTVTGQPSGKTRSRALRSRQVWEHIAPKAGIAIEHRGLYLLAQRGEAEALLGELLRTESGAELRWLPAPKLRQHAPHLAHAHIRGALYSPFELRIEAQTAIERLRLWLAARGVRFLMGHAVQQVSSGEVHLATGTLRCERVVVCPGADLRSLFPDEFERRQTQLCQLQMLRIRPPQGYQLGAAVMSDLSLLRYKGFSMLPGAGRLEDRLRHELPRTLEQGIHLIVVQSADGSLVVGDSHHYGELLPPFAAAETEQLILAEMQRLLCLGHYQLEQRWSGIYPSATQDAFYSTVLREVQLLSVTSGAGMSTAFALAEECLQGKEIST